MKLSKRKIIIIVATILLALSIIITVLLFNSCSEKGITKITYLTSSNENDTITACYINSITDIYLVDYSGNTLKNLTNKYNTSTHKKSKVMLDKLIGSETRHKCPFEYSDIVFKPMNNSISHYAYSNEFKTFVKFEVFYKHEDTIFIKMKNNDNLTTITYPDFYTDYNTYSNDTYSMKTITIPTENILTIEY